MIPDWTEKLTKLLEAKGYKRQDAPKFSTSTLRDRVGQDSIHFALNVPGFIIRGYFQRRNMPPDIYYNPSRNQVIIPRTHPDSTLPGSLSPTEIICDEFFPDKFIKEKLSTYPNKPEHPLRGKDLLNWMSSLIHKPHPPGG